MPISDTIKKLRTDNALTQVELAEKLNCNRQKIADWERGKSTPSADDLIILSKQFNVSTDYLLGLTSVKTTNKDLSFMCDYTNLSENSINFLHSMWAPSVSDIIDFFLGATSYHDFWGFCHELRKYRMQYRELLEDRERIMNDKARKPSSFDELKQTIEHYDLLSDSKDLCEFKLQKLFTNMCNSYCKLEVEADNKNKVEFQKTYDYLLENFMCEFILSKDGDENGNDQQA